jgi:hypothetical protein
MELLVGDSLDEWLHVRGTMPELDAIKVILAAEILH